MFDMLIMFFLPFSILRLICCSLSVSEGVCSDPASILLFEDVKLSGRGGQSPRLRSSTIFLLRHTTTPMRLVNCKSSCALHVPSSRLADYIRSIYHHDRSLQQLDSQQGTNGRFRLHAGG